MKFEFWVLIKGMLMGAADIVPGVSGGTIAFITGIYERLLHALKTLLPAFLALLKHRQLSVFLKKTDFWFLVTLFVGIVTSVITLAKGITFLMQHYPVPLWSGFFGLILGSVFIVAQDVKNWSIGLVFSLLAGVLIALAITHMTPASLEKTTLSIFISGLLAICAMVLPGISGSFILVILGSYAWVLDAVKQLEWETLSLFCLGCLIGLLSIANILSWAFDKFREITLALLTGFMLGALAKVWPWKEVISYRENSKGELVPLLEETVWPVTYELITGNDAQLMLALFCSVLAGMLVLSLSFAFKKTNKKG